MTSSFFTGKIVREERIDLETEKSKLHPGAQFRESHDSNSTSFSPFSEISFSNCVTIVSRRAITAFTSSLVR